MYLTLITVLDYTNYMYIATPVLKQTTNKVKSHGSNVRNIRNLSNLKNGRLISLYGNVPFIFTCMFP